MEVLTKKYCQILIANWMYINTPYVHLKVYPSPENLTQALLSILVTFRKSAVSSVQSPGNCNA